MGKRPIPSCLVGVPPHSGTAGPSATLSRGPGRLCAPEGSAVPRRWSGRGKSRPRGSLGLCSVGRSAQWDRQLAPGVRKVNPGSGSRAGRARVPTSAPRQPPHLHGDVGREDQQAECLDALGQAAGRLPGGRAVAHIRGAGERGGGLNKSQSQDQENGEAQNPGKGTKTGQKARTSHTLGPKKQISRRDARKAAGQAPRVQRPEPTLPAPWPLVCAVR